jgi:hypothetical protein
VVFGIEDGAVIRNDYGLIIYLGQGQKVEITFLEEQELFEVVVHEYNELDLKIEVHGEGRLIEPGTVFTVDPDLNIEIVGAVEEEPEIEYEAPEIPPELLELEEPVDEPFENAGDLESIHFVSPSKP